MARYLIIFLLLACFLPASACKPNDGLARIAVYGSITLEGQPVERGLITFRPMAGAAGPVAGGVIKKGQYRIVAEKGPIAGSHEVTIKVVAKESSSQAADAEPTAKVRPVRMKSFSQPLKIGESDSEFNFSLPFETPGNKKTAPAKVPAPLDRSKS